MKLSEFRDLIIDGGMLLDMGDAWGGDSIKLFVTKGDISQLDVDAIVNAANISLMRGGGVCGAIFKAAGSGLD